MCKCRNYKQVLPVVILVSSLSLFYSKEAEKHQKLEKTKNKQIKQKQKKLYSEDFPPSFKIIVIWALIQIWSAVNSKPSSALILLEGEAKFFKYESNPENLPCRQGRDFVNYFYQMVA